MEDKVSSYSLGGEILNMRIKNRFTDVLFEACTALTNQLRPFTFLATELQTSRGVIDISTIQGLDNPNLSIRQDIAYYRLEEYNKQGIFLPKLTDEFTNTLYLEYLLSVAVCYVEEPTTKQVDGIIQEGYNKFLATRNIPLLARWLGITVSECIEKYGKKLTITGFNLESSEITYIKLNISAKNGITATTPRNKLNLQTALCTPAFCLGAMIDSLTKTMSSKLIHFKYLKDNHIERELTSTLSEGLMKEFYKSDYYISNTLSDSTLGKEDSYSYITRGNVKVPELGCSMFEQHGTRTLNLTRILSMSEVSKEDVDTRFIDIDLNGVLDEFSRCMHVILLNNPDILPEVVNSITGGTVGVANKSSAMLVSDVCNWVFERAKILSTEFKRSLHLFMIGHEEWFRGYTGKPQEIVKMPLKPNGV